MFSTNHFGERECQNSPMRLFLAANVIDAKQAQINHEFGLGVEENESFSIKPDVCFIIRTSEGDKRIFAHKAVLYARLFWNNLGRLSKSSFLLWQNREEAVTEIEVHGHSYETVRSVLEFAYCGNYFYPRHCLESLQDLARRMHIENLEYACKILLDETTYAKAGGEDETPMSSRMKEKKRREFEKLSDEMKAKIKEEQFRIQPHLFLDSQLSTSLRGLVNNENFSDITFTAENRDIRAHSLFLLRCDYFKALLFGNMRSRSSVIPISDETDYSTFMYMLVSRFSRVLHLSGKQS